jgi:hypothetical protein
VRNKALYTRGTVDYESKTRMWAEGRVTMAASHPRQTPEDLVDRGCSAMTHLKV